jgi:hypothetical protein
MNLGHFRPGRNGANSGTGSGVGPGVGDIDAMLVAPPETIGLGESEKSAEEGLALPGSPVPTASLLVVGMFAKGEAFARVGVIVLGNGRLAYGAAATGDVGCAEMVPGRCGEGLRTIVAATAAFLVARG